MTPFFPLLSLILKRSLLCFYLSSSVLLMACGGGSSGSNGDSGTPDNSDTNTGVDVQIELEDYDRFNDTTEGNEGGEYRTDDVDIEASSDTGAGYNVGWLAANEWLEYDVAIEAGTYVVSARVASNEGGARYRLYLDDTLIAEDTVDTTGGWQSFETHDIDLVDVQSGTHELRFEVVSGPFNINWVRFTVDDGTFVPPVVEPPEEQLPLPDVVPVSDPNALSPATAIEEMGIGINLGNTLDAPYEGDWALAAEQRFIQDFKAAGFNHVRIPVRWDNHIGESLPYEVDEDFMNRVEEIVDWALDEDLYVILNAHHDNWIKVESPSQALLNRFDSIWMQVTERFKNKSPKLMFEILNEPHGMTVAGVDSLNIRALSIIRNANPTRLVVYSGNGYTPLDDFLAAAIPDEMDQYLIGNFHSYDPWPFAGQCTQNWGTVQDRANLEAIYDRAQSWSSANGIPLMVNEFGSAKYDFEQPENVCEQADRLAYIQAHVTFASERGIAATFWDDGGSFSTYVRDTYSWGPEKDILVAPNLSVSP